MRRMPLSRARDKERKRLARLEWLSTPRDFQPKAEQSRQERLGELQGLIKDIEEGKIPMIATPYSEVVKPGLPDEPTLDAGGEVIPDYW